MNTNSGPRTHRDAETPASTSALPGPGVRFHHVGIVVEDAATVGHRYRTLFEVAREQAGDDVGLQVRWLWLVLAEGPVLEFIAPYGDGAFRRYLESHGEGLHHLSFETSDFAESLKCVKNSNAQVIGLDRDHDGWQEFFLHPRSMGNVLVQIAQPPPRPAGT